jgi:hypothetical protein
MKFLILGFTVPLLLLAGSLPAQHDAAIFSATGASPYSGYLSLVNMAKGTLTTVWTLPGMTSTTSQRTRGGVFGPDGLLYVGLWDHNGAGVVDPKTGAWIRYVVDHCNCVLGAPYQPAPNRRRRRRRVLPPRSATRRSSTSAWDATRSTGGFPTPRPT